MKSKRDFIKTISIIDGNLTNIEQTKRISGTLLIEIERVMDEYAEQQVKNNVYLDNVSNSNLKGLKPLCPKCDGNDFNWSECKNCGYDPFK